MPSRRRAGLIRSLICKVDINVLPWCQSWKDSWTNRGGDNRNDRCNLSSLPHGLPPTWVFEATAEANEGWTISASPGMLKERSARPPSPQLESLDSSSILRAAPTLPTPLSAGSLHFLFLHESIEFRVTGGNEHLIRVAVEHKPEWNHLNLRFSVSLPEDIDRADGICRFASIAVPALK